MVQKSKSTLKHKRLRFIGIGAACLVLCSIIIAYSINKNPQKKESAKTPVKPQDIKGTVIQKSKLKLVRVQNQEKSIEVQLSGRVTPQHSTQIFSEVQGRIMPGRKNFKEGVTYLKGENLLQIDFKEFALNLESQKSTFLNILTGMMPDLKADYPDNYPNWLKYIQNYQTGQVLKPLPKTLNEGEKYFVTSNQVYSTYFAIKAQEERLRKYTILAPYNCILTQALVDVGGLVSPGQPLGTIMSNGVYELEAGIQANAIQKLNVGDRITFTSNEIEGKWIGKVIRINNIIDEKTQHIPVYFQITGPATQPGLYLEGDFVTEKYPKVFGIHNSWITRNNTVRILVNDIISSQEVIPVAYLRDSIYVRGLQDKDLLVTNQFNTPVEGKKVIQ